jgi:hypothetical protein
MQRVEAMGMLWSRNGTSLPGRPAVDLRSLVGLPGRLSFAEGAGGSRMAHLACTIRRADHSSIVLDLAPGATPPPAESAVILEVTDEAALVQCFTTVRTAAKGGEVVLRTPARPHVVQRRRFPRVDVFIGVTLHTPDRPIEPLAGQMTNLSMDGAACVLAEPLAPGTPVTANLGGMGMHPPEVSAVVRRCTPTPSQLWVVGLQFQSLVPSQELYLGKYLADFTEQQVD